MPRGRAVARVTPTLVKLHIEQGYLGEARRLLEELDRTGGATGELRALLDAAMERRKLEAQIELLRRLLSRIHRARTGEVHW